MKSEMQDLMNLLKSNDISDRKKAMEGLWNWNEVLEVEDRLSLLEYAGRILPICDEPWDNPSEALVDAACIILDEAMVPVFERHIYKYSISAINVVLSKLLFLHSEEAIQLYKKVYHQLLNHVELLPNNRDLQWIAEDKHSSSIAIETLLENEANFHLWYIEYYHYLIVNGLKEGYFEPDDFPLEHDFIIEKLEFHIEQYLQYDKDYSREYVYEAWGQSYKTLRFMLKNYLTLYDSFSSEEELLELQFIFNWHDTLLKLHYIEILWKREIEVDEDIFLPFLTSDENASDAYAAIRQYKPDLLPKDVSYQNYFIKETAAFHFFNHSGINQFPSEIEVMGSFERADFYGESLTYYMVRFKSNDPTFADDGWMRMLIGAYYTQNLPTSFKPQGLEDNFTDFKAWDEQTMEEHEQEFRDWLIQKHGGEEEDEVYYSYAPTFNRKYNTMAILLFFFSIGMIFVNDWFLFGMVLTPIWWLLKYVHSRKLAKNVYVRLRGHYMDYFCFDDGTGVQVNQIETVKFEKRWITSKEHFLHIPVKIWHFGFYDIDGDLLFSIPRSYLQEEYFFPILRQQTEHLAIKPRFEWEQDE